MITRKRFLLLCSALFVLFTILSVHGCKSQVTYDMPSPDIVILSETPSYLSNTAWPVLSPFHRPDGLRPCCAFGSNLKAEMMGVPVPFYEIDNIVETDHLGEHRYNDSFFRSIGVLMGMSNEKLGIIYTKNGGFIDVAHVRDTIDNTLYLFSHLYANLGSERILDLGSKEIMYRYIQLFATSSPLNDVDRYNISALLAAKLAYEMAVWHEIAQWYGHRSVILFSEKISAFSPEDLYSNLLGSRIALDLILHGYAQNHEQFNQAVTYVLPDVLNRLGAVDRSASKQAFKKIDGIWWDSQKRVPDTFLVLYRNYSTSDYIIPSQLIGSQDPVIALTLAHSYKGVDLAEFGEIQLRPANKKVLLNIDKPFLTQKDFQLLADNAEQEENELKH